MTEDVKNIKIAILDCIDKWVAKASMNPFSWVDDELELYDEIGEDKAYRLHIAWVGAWNNSDREKPMEIFLWEWVTDENIRKALPMKDIPLVRETFIANIGTRKGILFEENAPK